ncbi:MAG: nucleoside recognition domain-containing protein [Candidatus Coproplasma sp.]
MNVIFTSVMLISALLLCFISPSDFLPTVLDGGLDAVKCALTLFCIYVFWMGLSSVAEEARLTQGVAKLLSPLCRKLFKTEDKEIIKNTSMNISCNLLGIGGAATPYGVKAVEGFEREGNGYSQDLLFIINATSIQIVPATVIALRASLGSSSAYDITLPSLIASCISTFTGVALYFLITKIKTRVGKKRRCST